METLTSEIKNCLLNKLWYAGLVLTLMLPDVCGALESSRLRKNERFSVDYIVG